MKIGYIFDEGFSIPAAVSIYSLLSNNKHLDIEIIILDDGISALSKARIIDIVSQFERKVEFIDVTFVRQKLSQLTEYNWNGSYSTYIRLMLNTLLPNDDETIVMIDGDTIIDGAIDELEKINLNGKPCAMALEAMPLSYYRHSKLGMNELINGGLLVIDLKLWKQCKIEEKIITYLNSTRSKNMLTDEDVLSDILKGQIQRIPPHLNYLTQYYLYSSKFYYCFFGWNKLYKYNAFYALQELIEAKNKPVVYHCIDTFTNRPWYSNNIHPYSELFDSYMAQTPWKGSDKPRREMNGLKSFEYSLRKILPAKLSAFMYAIVIKLYYGPIARKFYS